MTKFTALACATLLGLAVFSGAQAGQIDFGTYVQDDVTGLDWLKPGETSGITYDNRNIIPELSTGWRYATRTELHALFEQFAPVSEFEIYYNPNIANEASAFLTVFGTTYDGSPGDGWFDYVWGYIDEEFSAGSNFTPWVGWDDELNSYGMFAIDSLDISYSNAAGEPTLGHWLVRETAAETTVPEPSTLAVIGAGLLALGSVRRRRLRH